MSSTLLSFGFIQIIRDPSLFVYARDDAKVYFLIYVDDMIITENDFSLMSQITDFLGTHFKVKDLGSLHYFLRIQVIRTIAGIYMNHQKYTMDILQDFRSSCTIGSLVPMEQHHTLLHTFDSPYLSDVTTYR